MSINTLSRAASYEYWQREANRLECANINQRQHDQLYATLTADDIATAFSPVKPNQKVINYDW
jgi:hypothetical protein